MLEVADVDVERLLIAAAEDVVAFDTGVEAPFTTGIRNDLTDEYRSSKVSSY